MEKDFRALLTGSTAVTALVAKSAIAFGVVPQGTKLPAIALNVVSNRDGLTMQGPDGLWQGRVQVDCYGADYGAAVALAEAVTGVLHGHRAGAFRLILLDSRRDHNEPGAVDRPFRIGLDFITNWRAGYAG